MTNPAPNSQSEGHLLRDATKQVMSSARPQGAKTKPLHPDIVAAIEIAKKMKSLEQAPNGIPENEFTNKY